MDDTMDKEVEAFLQAESQQQAELREASLKHGYEIITPDLARMAEESAKKHEAERYL